MRSFLEKNNYIFYYKYPLEKITTIKNKGTCKYYILISTFEEIINLIKFLKKRRKKYFIIGNGSKIVFKNNYYPIIISLKNLNRINYKEYVEVEAGCMISTLIHSLKKKDLGGIEELIGIPATIGGAIKNNASCHNKAISEYIESLIIIKNEKILRIKKNDIKFMYHNSSLDNCIILKCYFKFDNINKNEIKKRINNFLIYRKVHQVCSYPNVGSIFKNNEFLKAYEIIKKCNLEKYKYKNVQFSKKHLNFISIEGKTNGKYIYKFVKNVRKKVYKQMKINLESEIIFI